MTKLTMKLAVVAMVSLASVASSPVFAQATDFGQGAAVAACQGGEAAAAGCETAVASFLSALRVSELTPAEQDDALAQFVASLVDSCAGLPLSVRVALASQIRRVGAEFDDVGRGGQVASIADAVQAGTTVCTGAIPRANIS